MLWATIAKSWNLRKDSDLRIFAFLLLLGSTGFSVNYLDPGLDALFVAFILGIFTDYFLEKEVKEIVKRILKK